MQLIRLINSTDVAIPTTTLETSEVKVLNICSLTSILFIPFIPRPIALYTPKYICLELIDVSQYIRNPITQMISDIIKLILNSPFVIRITAELNTLSVCSCNPVILLYVISLSSRYLHTLSMDPLSENLIFLSHQALRKCISSAFCHQFISFIPRKCIYNCNYLNRNGISNTLFLIRYRRF